MEQYRDGVIGNTRPLDPTCQVLFTQHPCAHPVARGGTESWLAALTDEPAPPPSRSLYYGRLLPTESLSSGQSRPKSAYTKPPTVVLRSRRSNSAAQKSFCCSGMLCGF